MKHIGLFEGIGGFSLAAEMLDFNTIAWCEINKFCIGILSKRFEKANKHYDIYTTDFSIYRGQCDIITGGWPCPKYSKAGKQEGNEPLKTELIRATKEIMPGWFIYENVPGLLTPKLSGEHASLIDEMESAGYETRTFRISANVVGAKQIRERVWIVGYNKVAADTNTEARKLGGLQNEGKTQRAQNGFELFRNAFRLHWYEAISRVHRIFNGLPRKLDGHRNAALGNAIVPQVAFQILKTIAQLSERNDEQGTDVWQGKKEKI